MWIKCGKMLPLGPSMHVTSLWMTAWLGVPHSPSASWLILERPWVASRHGVPQGSVSHKVCSQRLLCRGLSPWLYVPSSVTTLYLKTAEGGSPLSQWTRKQQRRDALQLPEGFKGAVKQMAGDECTPLNSSLCHRRKCDIALAIKKKK